MNRRLTALLLVLMLGLQSVVPQMTFAAGTDVESHCSGMTDVPEASGHDRGCCPSEAGQMTCASHCAIASVALVASNPPSLAADRCCRYDALIALPLLSRFGIPPTPPPIA